MSDSTIVGLALATVAAIIYGPSVIDRARRNHRTRQARADYWNARIQWALEAGPLDSWQDAPAAEDDPIYQQMCFEYWTKQMEGESA